MAPKLARAVHFVERAPQSQEHSRSPPDVSHAFQIYLICLTDPENPRREVDPKCGCVVAEVQAELPLQSVAFLWPPPALPLSHLVEPRHAVAALVHEKLSIA